MGPPTNAGDEEAARQELAVFSEVLDVIYDGVETGTGYAVHAWSRLRKRRVAYEHLGEDAVDLEALATQVEGESQGPESAEGVGGGALRLGTEELNEGDL